MKMWPKPGSKLKYKGTHHFWFTNIIEDSEKLLEKDKEYTLAKLELYSSWCGVRLEEFPENLFALSFFEHSNDSTTDEVRKLCGYNAKSL